MFPRITKREVNNPFLTSIKNLTFFVYFYIKSLAINLLLSKNIYYCPTEKIMLGNMYVCILKCYYSSFFPLHIVFCLPTPEPKKGSTRCIIFLLLLLQKKKVAYPTPFPCHAFFCTKNGRIMFLICRKSGYMEIIWYALYVSMCAYITTFPKVDYNVLKYSTWTWNGERKKADRVMDYVKRRCGLR